MSGGSSNPSYDRGYEPSRQNQTGNGSLWFGPRWTQNEVRDQGQKYIETRYSNGQVYRTDTNGNTKRIK